MKDSKILYHKNPAFDKCPSCNELGSLRRSHSRTTFEKVLKATGFFKIFRCRKCGWRGTKFTFTFKLTSVKSLIWYILLILVTAAVVKIVISKAAGL